MKRLFSALAIVAVTILAASCEREQETSLMGGSTVTFTVNAPVAATKAISDGLSATSLTFAVYNSENVYLADLSNVATISGGAPTWNISIPLVKDLTYKFVFFAKSASDNGFYSLDLANKTLTVDYTKLAANSDAADAFYATTSVTVSGDMAVSVNLLRPLAQVNVGTGDLVAAGYSLDLSGMTTGITLTGIHNKMNLLDGTLTNDTADITLAAAARVNENTAFTTGFDRIAMAYVLAGETSQTTDLTLAINAASKDFGREVPNVPIRRNYRTNILGNFFTSNVNVSVNTQAGFAEVDTQAAHYVPEYATIADLNAAFAAGDGVGYQVAVTTPATGTITLPKTNSDVRIFIRGDWSANTVTLAYADGATSAEKPLNVYILAPALGTLNGEITSTHVEIETGSHITSGTLATSGGTLVIQPNAFMGIIVITAGSLKVEGEVTTATVESTAVGASTVVTSTGEVGTLTIKAGSVEVQGENSDGSAAKVDELIIDNTSGDVEDVVVNSEATVNSITGDTDTVKDENNDALTFVSTLSELNTALAGSDAVIYYKGDPITSAITINRNVTINGLKVNANVNNAIVTNANVVLAGATISGAPGNNGRIINVNSGSLTLSGSTVTVTALVSQTRALRAGAGTTVIIDDTDVVGFYQTSEDNLKIGSVSLSSGQTQGLGVGGNLTIKNGSSVTGFHYAVRTWNSEPRNKNQIVVVEDSFIDGWASLYLVDDYTTCSVKNSTVVGRNQYSGDSNAFAVIYMQPDNNEPGVLSLENSTIVFIPTANYETPIIVTDQSTINLSGTVTFIDKVKEEWSNHGMISIGEAEEVDGNMQYVAPISGSVYLNNTADVTIDGVDGAALLYSNITLL